MTQHTSDDPRRDRFARARDSEEPGAGSGSESEARERVVPGTASAREGYHQAGTGSGQPLKGVEAAGSMDTKGSEGSKSSKSSEAEVADEESSKTEPGTGSA